MIRAACDGSCLGNPGPGGWAAVLRLPTGEERVLTGGEAETTNNRMELVAAIHALDALPENEAAEILCDSTYVIQGVEQWVPRWIRRGWMTSKKQPVKNRDLWMRLADARAARPMARFRWVRGHAGNPDNERADALALQAARSQAR